MYNTPLVSVIIPNYCHEFFLRQRIESVLNQTYQHFEIILLDDCSSDESVKIIDQYRGHPKVTHIVINAVNSGSTFKQWQLGLSLAKGEFIWIAESDDVAQPTLLQRLVDVLQMENSVLAFAASRWIDEKGETIERRITKRWKQNFSMDGIVFLKKYLLGYNFIYNASAVVFKSDAIKTLLDSYTNYKASGDRFFWLQICLQGKVSYVAEQLNLFRQHTQKVSGHAAETGVNQVEDFQIYQQIKSILSLSVLERILICGYHYRAIYQSQNFVNGGKQFALSAWKQENFFNVFSYMVYLFFRGLEIAR